MKSAMSCTTTRVGRSSPRLTSKVSSRSKISSMIVKESAPSDASSVPGSIVSSRASTRSESSLAIVENELIWMQSIKSECLVDLKPNFVSWYKQMQG